MGVATSGSERCPSPRSNADPATTSTRESLLTRASSHLAPYEVPVAIVVVDELPRTASGKADLAAVRALFTDASTAVPGS